MTAGSSNAAAFFTGIVAVLKAAEPGPRHPATCSASPNAAGAIPVPGRRRDPDPSGVRVTRTRDPRPSGRRPDAEQSPRRGPGPRPPRTSRSRRRACRRTWSVASGPPRPGPSSATSLVVAGIEAPAPAPRWPLIVRGVGRFGFGPTPSRHGLPARPTRRPMRIRRQHRTDREGAELLAPCPVRHASVCRRRGGHDRRYRPAGRRAFRRCASVANHPWRCWTKGTGDRSTASTAFAPGIAPPPARPTASLDRS